MARDLAPVERSTGRARRARDRDDEEDLRALLAGRPDLAGSWRYVAGDGEDDRDGGGGGGDEGAGGAGGGGGGGALVRDRWEVLLPAADLAAITLRAQRVADEVAWMLALEAHPLTDQAKADLVHRLIAEALAAH